MRSTFLWIFVLALFPRVLAAGPAPADSSEAVVHAALPASDSLLALAGEPPEPSTLEARVAELEAQLRELERRQEGDAAAVRFSGQLFTRYGMNTSGTAADDGFNSFALDRWYFTARGRVSDRIGFRGTTDVVAADPASGLGYTVAVKYAYVDVALRPWLGLRTGVIQTGWPNHVTSVWGYRGIAKVLVHERKYLSTADLGATLTASLPARLGEAAIGVHNGPGFRKLEVDRYKDVSGRLVLTPFANGGGRLSPFQVGGHVYDGRHPDGRARTRWGGLAAFEGDRFVVAANFEARRDGDVSGRGLSAFGRMALGRLGLLGDVEVVGLVDRFDPNVDAAGDRLLRSVLGVAVSPASAITLVLDYQRVRADAPSFERFDGDATDVDAGLFLHAIVSY